MDFSEEEFDITQHTAEFVAVGLEEIMPSILERIEEAWTRTPNAVLVIPRGAHAFHSTHDFLALGKIQDSRQVRISIASPDPIITGLARLLGFYIMDPLPDHPALADDPITGHPTLESIEKPTAPLPLGGLQDTPHWVLSSPTPYQPPSTTTSTWLSNPDNGYYIESPQSASAHPGARPPRTRPRQTTHLPATIADISLPSLPTQFNLTPPVAVTTPTGRVKARRVVVDGKQFPEARRLKYGGRIRSGRLGRIFAILAALFVVALISGSAYAYVYLPEGSVSVIPLNKTYSDIPVGISILAGTGASSGQTSSQQTQSISSEIVQVPLREEGTRPASETRQVARGRGEGTIRFTNRTSNPVTVSAGTSFKAPNGATVKITQTGTIPATIFGQSFGTLDLPVAATVDGPDGNIGAGQMAGIYGGTLDYINSAMQGGSMETEKVITQADIDGLVAELRSKVEAEAASALLTKMGADRQLITQTLSIANSTFEADHKANDAGDVVRVSLSAEAQAYAYKETELHDAVSQVVLDYVRSSTPLTVGANLDLGSIQYAPPVEQSSDGGKITYQTKASARVTFSLTPELSRQIRDLVKGKAISQARNLIYERYGTYVNPDSIEARLLWFTLDRLPSDPARIAVEPSTGQPDSNPGISPLPQTQTTPDPRSKP